LFELVLWSGLDQERAAAEVIQLAQPNREVERGVLLAQASNRRIPLGPQTGHLGGALLVEADDLPIAGAVGAVREGIEPLLPGQTGRDGPVLFGPRFLLLNQLFPAGEFARKSCLLQIRPNLGANAHRRGSFVCERDAST